MNESIVLLPYEGFRDGKERTDEPRRMDNYQRLQIFTQPSVWQRKTEWSTMADVNQVMRRVFNIKVKQNVALGLDWISEKTI